MLNLKKALYLIFTVLLITSFMPFSTVSAHTTVNDSTPAADTQHEQHSTQGALGSHSSPDPDLGGTDILLLILFVLIVVVILGIIWWALAKKRSH